MTDLERLYSLGWELTRAAPSGRIHWLRSPAGDTLMGFDSGRWLATCQGERHRASFDSLADALAWLALPAEALEADLAEMMASFQREIDAGRAIVCRRP